LCRFAVLYVETSRGKETQWPCLVEGDDLLGTELKMLAPLDGAELYSLALGVGAFKLEHNLLGGLSLLVEDGLCLTTETSLLTIVTPLTYTAKQVSLATLHTKASR